MSSSIVITLAAIGGIAWLGFILVAALRRRGPEEVPSNIAPGTTDDEMETRRLESGQKAAVLLSAFLAVSLPLYFLGEQDRQEGFVEQFDEESVTRGEELVAEYACWDCHGPDGIGGTAEYVEKRSGVSVLWEAPSLNDINYRYEPEEINFWVTYGRGNTPMPAWGLDGGGPMNEQQVEDVVNYLSVIQIAQPEVVAEFETSIRATQASRLEQGEETARAALVDQRQILADINRAPDLAPTILELATSARAMLDEAGTGIDTDGDGLSDAAETGVVDLGTELVDYLRVVTPLTLDPEGPQSVEGADDVATAESAVAELESLAADGYPILATQAETAGGAIEGGMVDPAVGLAPAAVEALGVLAETVEAVAAPGDDLDLEAATAYVTALEEGAAAEGADEALVEAATEARALLDGGQDSDGDGLSTAAESAVSTAVTEAIGATTPAEGVVANIDPTNEATSGEPDLTVADTVVAGYEALAVETGVTADNLDAVAGNAAEGVAFLEQSLEEQRWAVDIEEVAEAAFDGDAETAERAVYLFNGYCARCHTAGFSAGLPFTLESGSGGFGPALWDGRPTVQFGAAVDDPEDDLLVQFITNGSESDTPYGLNGFGSGRMPAFGQILSLEDIRLIAGYLRGVDLTGMADEEVGP